MNLAYLRNDIIVFVMIVGTPDMTRGTYIHKNDVSDGGGGNFQHFLMSTRSRGADLYLALLINAQTQLCTCHT